MYKTTAHSAARGQGWRDNMGPAEFLVERSQLGKTQPIANNWAQTSEEGIVPHVRVDIMQVADDHADAFAEHHEDQHDGGDRIGLPCPLLFVAGREAEHKQIYQADHGDGEGMPNNAPLHDPGAEEARDCLNHIASEAPPRQDAGHILDLVVHIVMVQVPGVPELHLAESLEEHGAATDQHGAGHDHGEGLLPPQIAPPLLLQDLRVGGAVLVVAGRQQLAHEAQRQDERAHHVRDALDGEAVQRHALVLVAETKGDDGDATAREKIPAREHDYQHRPAALLDSQRDRRAHIVIPVVLVVRQGNVLGVALDDTHLCLLHFPLGLGRGQQCLAHDVWPNSPGLDWRVRGRRQRGHGPRCKVRAVTHVCF
mmetsp:Transcript_85738/g.246110  ORF Transcript_85738/g.246110 Transcript_85738/m.246110 type:complete len:368 (+) Transcript_85738:131-1234(+)